MTAELPRGSEVKFDGETHKFAATTRVDTKALRGLSLAGTGGVSRIPNGAHVGTVFEYINPGDGLFFDGGSGGAAKEGFRVDGIDLTKSGAGRYDGTLLRIHNSQNFNVGIFEVSYGHRGIHVTKDGDAAYWHIHDWHSHTNTIGAEIASYSGALTNGDTQVTHAYSDSFPTYGVIVRVGELSLDNVKVHNATYGFDIGPGGSTGQRGGIVRDCAYERGGTVGGGYWTAFRVDNRQWTLLGCVVNYDNLIAGTGLHITPNAKGCVVSGGSFDGSSWGNAKVGSKTIVDEWPGDATWPATEYHGRHLQLIK
jgi:hypothetical protein